MLESAGCFLDDLVLTIALEAGTSTAADLRVGLAAAFATRCLGASGGLFAAG